MMKFNINETINKKIIIDHSTYIKNRKINIAYGVDRFFLLGCGISITSVLINNPDININFYIFTDYIDDNYITNIENLAKSYYTSITIIYFNSSEFHELPSTKAWTSAMYYRYFAFEYLSTKVDSVLYLDADIICKGSLRQLTDIQFNGEYAAVVHDIDDIKLKSGLRLGIPELSHGYFNSGVVLANLVVWKEQSLLNKAFTILFERHNQLLYFDQDVLNILFIGNVISLCRSFNCIYGVDQELINKNKTDYKKYITNDTILIHYVGVTKPWHKWAEYPVSSYFMTAYKKSPWAEKQLPDANTAKLYKRKSRHERIQGKIFRSIVSHVMYIKYKLCNNNYGTSRSTKDTK